MATAYSMWPEAIAIGPRGVFMRVLTFINQTLDAEEIIRLRGNVVDRFSSKLVVDSMDDYSVEGALHLRDAGTEAEIIAISIGPVSMQDCTGYGSRSCGPCAGREGHRLQRDPLSPRSQKRKA